MPLLKVDAISCAYDQNTVCRDLSFHVNRGEIVSLLGPSGCGKTTVLRAIAGFEPVGSGQILIDKQQVSRPGFTAAPEHRSVGMVFQDYALFPHLSVTDNIAFGLKKVPPSERTRRVRALERLAGLEGMGARFPHELSGGQQQRVALARALGPQPRLLLLDEPFSNLDADLRERVSREVRDILKAHGTTAVLVTHDHQEAFALSDKVGVMLEGEILQWDTPYNLYHEPIDRFVASFVGKGRFIEGILCAPDAFETELGMLHANRAYTDPLGTRVDILLRPDDVVSDPSGPLRAEVVGRAFKGAEILYNLRIDQGPEVLGLFPSHEDHAIGDKVSVRIAAEHLISFPHRRNVPHEPAGG